MVTWLEAAVVSFLIAVAGMAVKARAAGMPLLSGPGRKFASSFAPAILVGGMLTVVLYLHGHDRYPALGIEPLVPFRGRA